MEARIDEYSVGQLARHAGVSVRTLHHYDDIGLLRPAYVGTNGYRSYGRVELLRLQEILFYRDAGLSLDDIDGILASPMTAVDRLIRHRASLQERARRTTEIIATLDATIAHLNGERQMTIDELYKPFSAERQAGYETWLVETYGPDMAEAIRISKTAMTDDPRLHERAMGDLRRIESDLVELFEGGATAEAQVLHKVLERHRAFVARLWGTRCGPDGYEGLAEVYVSNADFVARYEALSLKFSDWLPTAMIYHAARLRKLSDHVD